MKRQLLILLLACSVISTVNAGNPMPNFGFEEKTKGWAFNDDVSKVVPEAAHSGKAGMRVEIDKPRPTGSAVESAKFPIKPGQEITLSFWCRTKLEKKCGVYFFFYDKSQKHVGGSALKKSGVRKFIAIDKADDAWTQYTLKSIVPDKAAYVAVWIHAYSSTTGILDFDDFALAGIAPDAVPIPPRQRALPPPPPKPSEIPRRKTPPVIILKFDDVKQVRGKVHQRWSKLADYLRSRKIKGSFGVICQTLAEATPEYAKWIKDNRDSGIIEFWFHGWDHAIHEEDGVRYNEFKHRSYQDQQERFTKSQKLAQEKLGFAFETFGPTGGVGNGLFDENTIKTMAADPHMKAWLYPQPLDKPGRELQKAGKVTILDRVWAVNLEGAVGAPDLGRFLSGYAKNPEREYFVLQGHPAAWDDYRFGEFAKILDFLVERDAVFMTPMEYVNTKHQKENLK